MKTALFLTLFGLPSMAAVTGISPTTLNLTMVQSGPAAPATKIAVLGDGAYTATIAGSTTCTHYRYSALSGTAGTDGIWLYLYQTSVTQAPGSYNCNVVFTIGGSNYTVAVSYTVVRRFAFPYFTNHFKVPDSSLGCSKESAEHPAYGACLPDSYPARGWTPPVKGASYIDPTFGATVRRLSTASSPTYGSNSHINLDNTLITTFSGVAEDGVWTIGDLTRRGSHPMAGGGWWSLVNALDKYEVSGADIKRHRCDNVNCSSITTTTIFTHSEGLYQGGNADLSVGDVQAFWTDDPVAGERKDLCVVEILSGQPAVCVGLDDWPWGRPAATSPTQGSQATISAPDGQGYRYILVRLPYDASGANSRLMIYTYKNRTLTLITPNGIPKPYFPVANGGADASWTTAASNMYLMSGAHSDVLVSGGRAFYIPSDSVRQEPAYGIGIGWFDLTAIRENGGPATSAWAVEDGGWLGIGLGSQTDAEYPSAAQLAPVSLITNFSKSAVSPEGFGISALTHDGVTATITTALFGSPSNHGLSVGDSVAISNVEGVTGANGVFTTVTGTTGSTVKVTCSPSCSGTFSVGNSAAGLVKNQAQAWQGSASVFEAQTQRWWQHGPFHARRHMKGRAVQYNGCRGAYTDQFTHAGLSPDGSQLFFKDNHGQPCAGGAHLVSTGWNLAPDTPSRHFSRNGDGMEVSVGATNIAVRVSGQGPCTLYTSQNRDLVGAASTSFTLGSETANLTVSASSKYYLRLVCNEDTVAVEEITTTAAPSGTATLQVSGLAPAGTATMRVTYQATSASAACTAGTVCSVAINPTRGISTTRQTEWLDGGGSVIASEPAVIEAIP